MNSRDLLQRFGTPAMRWDRERLELLDQRRLPGEHVWCVCTDAREVARAIGAMVVRGAPAIGIAAACGMALAARRHAGLPSPARRSALADDRRMLAEARPTGVNLVHALARFDALLERDAGAAEFAELAEAIQAEDVAVNRRLAALGAEAIAAGARVLTHCNTGPLASGGIGTAFGVIAAAWDAGKIAEVAFSETRPWMQGARLTAWELSRAGIPATLMTESAAGARALNGGFDGLIVGADRIAANGDTANKIGTAPLAALVRRGGGWVMVVAPFATVDPALASGASLEVEQRGGAEVWRATQAPSVPPGIRIANPVFDVTPGAEIDFLVTERGVVSPANGERADALPVSASA